MSYDLLFGVLGVVVGATSSYIAFRNFARLKRQSELEDAEEIAEIRSTIAHLMANVEGLRKDVRELNALKVKVSALSETLKSAYKRIDTLENNKR